MLEIKSKIWTIVLHKSPDVDAIVGGWLLTRFGEDKNPGISEAKFLFWGGGPDPILEGKGFISIDIGGGKYDHHPANKFPEECATTLVAKDLGIDKYPGLIEILEYTKRHDLRGIRGPLDLADFVRCFNQRYPIDPEKVLEISFEILDALYSYYSSGEEQTQEGRDRLAESIDNWVQGKDRLVAQQILRFAKGIRNGNRKSFDLTTIFCALEKKYNPEKAQMTVGKLLDAKYFAQQQFFTGKDELKKAVVTPVLRGRKILNVISIESDNTVVASLARNKNYGYNAAIVIQRNSNGRTLIFTNNRFWMTDDLQNIVAAVRLEEQLQGKSEKLTLNFQKLTQPGYLPHVLNWYFQKENNPGGGKLLNGSLTSPDIEPTKIPLERIKQVVVTVLKLGRYFKWQDWIAEARKAEALASKSSQTRKKA